jgi:hypothetical protein
MPTALLHQWESLKCLSYLLLPWQTSLFIDLSTWVDLLSIVEEDDADNNLVAHDSLVAIHMGCAVGPVVAVYSLVWKMVSKC